MSSRAAERVSGQPTDLLFGLYMAVAAVALLFPRRPDAWAALLALHLLLVCAAWLPAMHKLAAPPTRNMQRLRSVLDWLPLLIMPVVYAELAVLNTAVHGGRYFDDVIIAAEELLFRGQPSQTWAAAQPRLWISEPLHAAYLSYYFIIFLPPLILFLRGARAQFRMMAFTLMLSFYLHYVFFVYFPVQGPRYLFPPPGGIPADGYFYQIAHSVLEAGSSRGSAFPSSHVGVSVAQTLLTFRYLPRVAPLIAVLTIGLGLGAVYGGFHYLTDALAGVLLGTAAFAAAGPLYRRLQRAVA